MRASRSVLIGLGRDSSQEIRTRLIDAVEACGYEPFVLADGEQAVRWVASEPPCAASLLDAALTGDAGRPVWRVVHQLVGRRFVLMAPGSRRELWFEALRTGVAAVLPLPPEIAAVRAALETARAGDRDPGHGPFGQLPEGP